jgi:tetratricopeptide (TPR) repeat protein
LGKSSPALAWYNRGLAQAKLGQYQEAIASYDQAVELNPTYSLALVERCQALSSMNQYSEALLLATRRFKETESGKMPLQLGLGHSREGTEKVRTVSRSDRLF